MLLPVKLPGANTKFLVFCQIKVKILTGFTDINAILSCLTQYWQSILFDLQLDYTVSVFRSHTDW